jgi:hypothetical protein
VNITINLNDFFLIFGNFYAFTKYLGKTVFRPGPSVWNNSPFKGREFAVFYFTDFKIEFI